MFFSCFLSCFFFFLSIPYIAFFVYRQIYGNNMTAQSWRSQYKLVQEWKAGKGLDAEEMVEDGWVNEKK